MRILCVVTGHYGRRIAANLAETAPEGWGIATWEGPVGLPQVLDDPVPYLPEHLPQVDLLLVLVEHPGVADLTVELAERCGATAVIAPRDRHGWLPAGLATQLERRLAERGVASAFPAPFCSLQGRGHGNAAIERFAARFGSPEMRCTVRDERIVECAIVRDAPCGCTRFVAERLAGVPSSQAAELGGLLHHYYPCLASMEDNGTKGHPLLHQAAKITRAAVARAVAGETHREERT